MMNRVGSRSLHYTVFGKGACSLLAEFGLQVHCWWETSWQEILISALEDVLGWFTEAKVATKQCKKLNS